MKTTGSAATGAARRRPWIGGGVVLLLAAALLLGPAERSPGADRPPNVILVLADDLGWSDLGCYGADLHETPRLDRLAGQGVRFTTAYAASVCSPTRAGLLTGVAPPAAAFAGAATIGQLPALPVWLGIAVVCVGLAVGLRSRGHTPAPHQLEDLETKGSEPFHPRTAAVVTDE